MKLNEFISLVLFGQMMQCAKDRNSDLNENNVNAIYNSHFFYTPRIYCKDGFNISIQVNNANYCSSENGYREYGLNWKSVEWGFPSKVLKNVKRYNPEDPGTTQTVGADVDIEIMDELLVSHGGIDVETTLKKYLNKK